MSGIQPRSDASDMAQSAFFSELGSALHDAAEQRLVERRRRRLGAQILAGVAAAAAAVVVAVSLDTAQRQPAAASVEVEVTGGRVELRLADLEANPADITEAAAEAGLDVRVVEVPVGPSMVGRFADMSADRPLPRTLERHDAATGGFSGFSIPRWWDGTLTLFVGRTAREGEGYKSSSNAFAPGEPLECVNIVGLRVSEVGERVGVQRRDLSIRWYLTDAQPPRYVDPTEHGTAVVTSAVALSATDLIIDITTQTTPALTRPRLDWCRKNTQ